MPAPLFDEAYLRQFPDRAIRLMLEHPQNLRELVAEVLPELVDGFDFSRVEPVSREFLMEDWRRRESDLLFRVPFRSDDQERWTLVCILVEHQSGPDSRMPLRLLLYAVLYWEREWKAWEESHTAGQPLRLTPVLPIVFHTGQMPWRTNLELSELIEGPEGLRRLAPHWPVLLWDLAERTPEQLLEQAGEWLKALAVVRAEQEDSKGFLKVFRKVLRQLEGLSSRERMRWSDMMHFVLSWALRRRPKDEERKLKQAAIASYRDRQRKKEITEMAEAVKQTWEEWVLEKGMESGQLRARQETLREQLEDRFGSLPEELVQRIEATTDAERLRAALRQVLHIRSLDELDL
jgi:hypothetical protein